MSKPSAKSLLLNGVSALKQPVLKWIVASGPVDIPLGAKSVTIETVQAGGDGYTDTSNRQVGGKGGDYRPPVKVDLRRSTRKLTATVGMSNGQHSSVTIEGVTYADTSAAGALLGGIGGNRQPVGGSTNGDGYILSGGGGASGPYGGGGGAGASTSASNPQLAGGKSANGNLGGQKGANYTPSGYDRSGGAGGGGGFASAGQNGSDAGPSYHGHGGTGGSGFGVQGGAGAAPGTGAFNDAGAGGGGMPGGGGGNFYGHAARGAQGVVRLYFE